MNARRFAVVLSAAMLISVGLQAADPPITTSQALDHIGKRATVCGDVVAVVTMQTPRQGGEQMFLHFDQPPPNSPFIAGIIGTDLLNRAFMGIEKAVTNKSVCVTGAVKVKGATPFMLLTGPNQLKIKGPGQS